MKKSIKKLILFVTLLCLVFNYTIIQPQVYAESVPENLESRYTLSEVVPENTKIRDQKQTPWCLSFSSLAALESTLAMQDKKSGNQAEVYDF